MARSCSERSDLGDVRIDCTSCGVKMVSHLGSGNRIRYFHCNGCRRWVSSTYSEVLQLDSKFRARKEREAADARVLAARARLEQFLGALEAEDPYRVLGASPKDGLDTIKSRYRALAMNNHPDRGGSPEEMRKLNAAYEQVVHHRARAS